MLKNFPYISLMGDGTFTIDHDGIDITISPRGDSIFFLNGNDKKKKFTIEDYEKIGGDANYLVGSILGALNLSDKELTTIISLEFLKKGVFKKTFTSKVNKNGFKSVHLKEVLQISFSVEDKEEKTDNTEVVYHFESGDTDEITAVKKSTKVFSPLDISGTINKFLRDLNSILMGW